MILLLNLFVKVNYTQVQMDMNIILNWMIRGGDIGKIWRSYREVMGTNVCYWKDINPLTPQNSLLP